ncbi:MAG: glycosyltransferase, partial [Gemmatimonadales bacterium]
MDKYAHRLHDWLESSDLGFQVRLAAHIGALTRDSVGRRGSATEGRTSDRRKAFVRWWTQPVDPSRVILPGPLHGPQQWAARYYFYPWRVKREAKRSDVVHVLDHSYAHMIEKAGRRPVVVTVHDLMPVVVLRSPTGGGGWREGVRNRFLRQALKSLRQADSYIVGTEWLKRELATWLGNDKNIHVVPFGVDRAFFGESPTARERGRRDWRIPEEAFVVLHVGSTVDRKNVPLLIQTVARLRQQTDAYLLQVGARFTAEQEQLIDRLELRSAVRSVASADETA